MRISRAYSLCAALAVAALSQPTLAATDTKDYPGTLCVPAESSPHHLFLDGQGGIFNGSGAEDVTMFCPITRDLKRITSLQVRLSVTANASTFCALRTIRSDRSIQAQQGLFTAFVAPTNTQLTFAGQAAPSTGAGIYTLECELPQAFPGSFAAGILMYRVVESD